MFSEILALLMYTWCAAHAGTERPHIIFILADDMGWNDVSFNGSPEIPTPNIDALAASGIILNRQYTAPQCTPSRASLLTGRYPSNTGVQHFVLLTGQLSGLPLNLTIMPQHFKRLGYATHAVGKWHLGYSRNKYTPTFRGFDSFYGYWNGEIDHYDYTNLGNQENMWGIDLHDGLKPIKNVRGEYAAIHFTRKVERIIRKHNASQPLFLYVSQTVPHTGLSYQRLQAPPEHVAKFKHIKDLKRRIFAGAISTLDESVGRIFAALDAKCMLRNSIVIFVSDNGAEVGGQRGDYGSNWPLRGSKLHLWEGGVRTPALIWSPLLHLRRPRVSTQLMHISDWLPTLYSAAGGNVADLGDIDGIDMWRAIVRHLPSPRKEMLLNVDPIYGMYSLIRDDYKLINGTCPKCNRNLWHGPSGRKDVNVSSMDDWVFKDGSVVKDILEKNGRWLITKPNLWRRKAIVDCGQPHRPEGDGGCDLNVAPCLYNIKKDPCEYHNLAARLPHLVHAMFRRIKELNATSLEAQFPDIDSKADPRCHGFVFVPWLEPEHKSELCELSYSTSPPM